MSVATHLGIRLGDYDRHIRTFIPRYSALLDATAAAVTLVKAERLHITDLGTGTGALAARCLRLRRDATLTGLDADAAILALARRRLARHGSRVALVAGSFAQVAIPPSDAIVATLALHHLRTPAAKRRFYARCFAALKPGGVLASGDCMPPRNAALAATQHAAWAQHLRRRYSARQTAGYFAAWAEEDRYFTLDAELEMMTAAGFRAEVVWRNGVFATVVGWRGRRPG
jgi:tRNA (cmo5U34)-methyltransferase